MNASDVEKAIGTIADAVENQGFKIYRASWTDEGRMFTEFLVFPRNDRESGEDLEVVYALNENNNFRNLRRGETMYFQPIRDDNRTKGIIMRIC